jgi:transcriptional regulator GlxA family with amidase domain
MAEPSSPTVVALLGAPEVSAATLYGFYDCLAGACRDWQIVHGTPPSAAVSPFRPLVVSRDGKAFTGANGVRITPDASFEDCGQPDVVIVTDLMIPPGVELGERYEREAAWLRNCHAQGALVASACSGAILLARAGLLEGLDATSHWAYCDALRRQYPSTRWHPERGLVVAGEGQRILMAGSGVAWHQLVLSLIARRAGPEAAMQVARMNLLDWNTTSPIAYASLLQGARCSDPVVAKCQEWAAMHYESEAPVSQMVALSGLPERTFKRRFARTTGMSPIEYVHTLRLEEAKQMLESGDQPVEEIALQVGYQDASFFGQLFRRRVALTPAQYRRRFSGLKHRLQEVQPGLQGPGRTEGASEISRSRPPPRA